MPRTDTTRRWLVLIVAVAAVLRVVPIWFGLPFEYARPDEEVAIGHAVNVLGGELNPGFFHWPSLTFYLLAACFWIDNTVRRVGGLASPTYVSDLLIARGVVAMVGTATIALVYRLGRRVGGDRSTGAIAAGFLAVAPLHVRDSHFAMTDVLATFFAIWSLLLLVRAMDDRATRSFAVSGFVGGLGASTKYSMAAVVIAMAAAQVAILAEESDGWRSWRSWRPSIGFVVSCAVGFLVGTPFALLDSGRFLEGLKYDFSHLSEGHNGLQVGVGWSYHLLHSLPAALGWPIFAAGLVGFLVMIRRDRIAAAVLVTFCAALYISLGPGHTVFFRYTLPLVPLLCVAAACAVRATSLTPIAVLLAAPALATSVWSDAILARTDTRVLAAQWLSEHARATESIYQAGSHLAGVPLGPLQLQGWPQDTFDTERRRFVANAEPGQPDWLIIPESPLALYTTVPPSLRAVAMQQYDLAHRVRATRPDITDAGVYDFDDAFFLPVSGFRAILRPGPTLTIYRRTRQH